MVAKCSFNFSFFLENYDRRMSSLSRILVLFKTRRERVILNSHQFIEDLPAEIRVKSSETAQTLKDA